MSDGKITRKELRASLGNIGLRDWQKAADKLGLPVTHPGGGSSHYSIRIPQDPIDDSVKGLISTINKGMGRQANINVFKRLLAYGIEEDEIWRALEKLK